MDQEKIIQIVTERLLQSIQGQEAEDNKFDFKRSWYNLKSKRGLNEFLKDVTSIANTFGPDGYIVIGFDEKDKEFHDAKFSDSELRDKSDVYGIINKRTSNVFDINITDIKFENNNISVIHIPPAINKPIFINLYEKYDRDEKLLRSEKQRIFIRKNSGTQFATKQDLELMYYDRKNIEPLYGLNFTPLLLRHAGLRFSFSLQVVTSIENIGRRPVAFTHYKLQIKNGELEETKEMDRVLNDQNEYNYKGEFTRKANPNTVIDLTVNFLFDGHSLLYSILDGSTKKDKFMVFLELYSTNGKIYSVNFSDIEILVHRDVMGL